MKSRFDYIESRLQALIENSLAWLPWRSARPKLAETLIEAVRAQLLQEVDSNQPAANIFHIFMEQVNINLWQAHAEWQTWLINAANEMANEAGITFFAAPELAFKTDNSLNKREVRVVATFPRQEVDSTAVMAAASDVAIPAISIKISAFLLLPNKANFSLDKPVINIGRRSGNHLVLDDMRVSRDHAQIRSVHSNSILFDLNSTGGTFVNGNRISQHTLTAGDVISFGGVAVIYGEETVQVSKRGGTSPSKIEKKDGREQ